jgi:hypothetical protein
VSKCTSYFRSQLAGSDSLYEVEDEISTLLIFGIGKERLQALSQLLLKIISNPYGCFYDC